MIESAVHTGTLTSGALGKATGVSADTIRHYEKLGLLAKSVRSTGGYRLYEATAIARVQTVQSALKAGFTLAELSGIFRERDAGGIPCDRVVVLAAEKVEELERQIEELIVLKAWLASTVEEWQKRLEGTPVGKRAGLLESLRRQPSLDQNPLSKGTNNENNHPHFGSVPRRRRTGAVNHAVSHARSAPKGR